MKQKHFPPTFYEWLIQCERSENALKGKVDQKPRETLAFNPAFIEDQKKLDYDVITESLAKTGPLLRRSFKFRIAPEAMYNLVSDEEITLPYPTTLFLYELEERPVYILLNEISEGIEYRVAMGREDQGRKIEVVPAVFLIIEKTTACMPLPTFTTESDEAQKIIKLFNDLTLTLLTSIQYSLHHPHRGIKPSPKIRVPARKKPFFEHYVLDIDLSAHADPPSGERLPQPEKRLHSVRGFWRTLSSGKRIWVKAHWRGNKELGVVKKDYNIFGAPHEVG